jgi:hypothetical protein
MGKSRDVRMRGELIQCYGLYPVRRNFKNGFIDLVLLTLFVIRAAGGRLILPTNTVSSVKNKFEGKLLEKRTNIMSEKQRNKFHHYNNLNEWFHTICCISAGVINRAVWAEP